MSFDLFINFDGNCREAAEFYAKVFQSEVQRLMTYSDAPPDPDYATPEADRNRIMYCQVPIFGHNVMFSDCPSGMEFIQGNNICPTLGTGDKDEIRRLFAALAEGGEEDMELQQTFWSELYGMVTDKYGVTWQLSYAAEQSTD